MTPTKPLKIGNLEIPCYVLEDGTRVLIGKGINAALGLSTSQSSIFYGFMGRNDIKPFIDQDLANTLNNPIRFTRPGRGGKAGMGYEATILPKICNLILEGYDKGRLQGSSDSKIIKQCNVLIRALSRIGIIALVDEATGYQEVRKRNDLQKILEAYLKDEFAPRTKKFPDEYYKHLLRLWLGEYNPSLLKKKPQFVGNITNKFIYKKLPEGVLRELKEKAPKSKAGNTLVRFHQYLTEDIGEPHLQKQLIEVITLMKISKSKEEFKRHFARAFPEPDKPKQEELALDIKE